MSDEQETGRLSPTALAAAWNPAETPKQIGPYKILEQIGEGGMGVVYLAEQTEPVHRRVALKIIKIGMDTKQVVARFEAERQALAMMDHPNVAKVFDGGATDTGRPYFVMEHVAGIPINEHCDRQRLSIEERLQLFMLVCDAVQHAHQKGIIHRDLKPSNILVSAKEGEGVPKVIDFGVAKALHQKLTEQTLFTEQGQLIGTPEYMSPEQAEMTAQDIDTRSDIYSLGVLLYELLTGERPFPWESLRQAGLAEIQRIIREEDPPKPSTRISGLDEASATNARSRKADPRALSRRLRGDLDWIVMKAMEKDRTRRYETAYSLADDLKRHLAHEPVQAGPPSAIYRLGKFVRRNRVAAYVVAMIFVCLTAATIVSTLYANRAERARRDAVVANAKLRLAVASSAHDLGQMREVSLELIDMLSSWGREHDPDVAYAHWIVGESYREERPEMACRYFRLAFADASESLVAHGDMPVLAGLEIKPGRFWTEPLWLGDILGGALESASQIADDLDFGRDSELAALRRGVDDFPPVLIKTVNPSSRPYVVDELVGFYSAYHELEPTRGFDEKADNWRTISREITEENSGEGAESPGG